MCHLPSTEALPGESGSPSAVIMTAPRSTPLSGRNMVLGYTEAGSCPIRGEYRGHQSTNHSSPRRTGPRWRGPST